MITLENAYFSYDHTPVLEGFSLAVAEGERVALLGASGCGKSTVVRLVAGLEECAAGLRVDARVSAVLQDAALMPWASVADNVALPLTLSGRRAKSSLISKRLADVGLADFETRMPATLSGGQKMRVSLARALMVEAPILVMDEPFGAVDELQRLALNDLILDLHRTRRLTLLFVTHSLYEASYLADRVVVMHGGRIVGEVTPGLDHDLAGRARRTDAAVAKAVGALEDLLEERNS